MEKVSVYYLIDVSNKPQLFKTFEAESIYINATNGILHVSESSHHALFSGPIEKFIAVRETKVQ